MARAPLVEIDEDATPEEIARAFDPLGVRNLSGRLERIEELLMPLSARSRLLLLNALLRTELDRARDAARR